MSNSKELLASFYQKTITKEWDVVIAYDRERANALLEQEYIQKVLSGEGHFPAINWKSKDGYYSFSNLTIGKPLISFEDSDVTSSIIIATLPFISGSVVEFDSNNTVIALTEITEVNDFKIKLRINLSEGQGEVNSDQGVVIKFKQGTLLDLSLPINIHAEVNYFFEQLLKNSDVEYQLGTVNTGTNEIFMPREFIIRTQPAPGARVRGAKNYGHGAILIFIMTNYSAKGTQGEAPKSDFPYIIPNDATATYIISNQVFFDGYLQQELKNSLGDGLITKFEKINKNDAMSASKLNIFMSDFKSLVWIDFVTPSTDPMMNFPTRLMHHVHNEITSLNYLYLVIDELSLSPNDFGESYGILSSLRNGGIHINHKFTYIKWKYSMIGPIQERLNYDGIKFTKGDIVNHKPIITNDGLIKLPEKIMVSDVIEFTGDKVPNEFSSHITNYSKYVNKEVSKWFDFKISDINTTLFSSILFSEKNTLHFKSASITGDLVLFGDIAPVLTAFQITPLQTVLALKDSLLFRLSSDHAVIWSISPAESGTIDANTGLYTAPDKLPLENHLVTVTATDAKGQQASALIKLEASSVVIPARFNIIREKNKEQIQLVTSVISQSAEETINWIISDASNSNSGSVSQTGLYTPPEEEFEKGHTFITVTAKVASGSKGNSIVCLIGNNTLEMFQPNTEEHNTAYGVGLSKGYINSGIIYEQKSTHPTLSQLISGTLLLNKPSVAATQVAINGLLFKPGLTPDGQWQITAEINEEQSLITRFVHSKINDFGGFEKSEYLHHSSRLDFSAHYAPEFMESGEITLTNTPIKSVFNATINDIRAEPFKTSLSQLSDDISNALTEKIAIDIPDIYDLTKQVISLSNHSKPKFSSLEIPGDMFLEGQLESAGQIEPAYSTLLANQHCQFSISDDVIRTWEISPASMGSIDANTGLYCAPKTLTAGLNQVVITATDAQGNQRHALCNLQASIAIETSFLTIREKENIVTPLQFKAMLDPSLNGKLTWKLLNASNSNIGSLTPEGLYYPPILGFNPGYTFITIQVSADNGESDQAIICLVSANTFALFVPSPSGTVLLSNGDEQHFTCQGDDDFPPDHWEIHPQIGLLSPSLIYEDGVKANSYSAVYTAPDNGEGNQTVMLTISSEGKPYFATYVMIELGAQS